MVIFQRILRCIKLNALISLSKCSIIRSVLQRINRKFDRVNSFLFSKYTHVLKLLNAIQTHAQRIKSNKSHLKLKKMFVVLKSSDVEIFKLLLYSSVLLVETVWKRLPWSTSLHYAKCNTKITAEWIVFGDLR